MTCGHPVRESLRAACLGAVLGVLCVPRVHAGQAPDDPPEVAACSGKKSGDACEFRGKSGACRSTTCNRLDYSQGSPPEVIESPCLDCVAADASLASPPPAAEPIAPPPAAETAGRCRVVSERPPVLLLLLLACVRRRRR